MDASEIIGYFLLVFATAFVVLLILGLGYTLVDHGIFVDDECFDRIGERFCKNKDMHYFGFSGMFDDWVFFCLEDERSQDKTAFKFLESEIERCGE